MKIRLNSIGWLVSLCLVLVIASGCFRIKTKYRSPRIEFYFEENDSAWTGNWKALGAYRSTQLNRAVFLAQIRNSNGKDLTYTTSVQNQDFVRLWDQEQNESGNLEINTEAGSLIFYLENQETNQEGLFKIEPNEAFRKLVESISGSPLNAHHAIIAILQETQLETLKAYQATGIDLRGDHLWSWIRFRVSRENVVLMQKHLPDISASDVIQLKRHGVPSEMIAKLADHYPNYEVKDYVKIRRSGVNAKYALEAAKSSYDFKADELVNLRRHGVPAEWAAVCDKFPIVKGADDMVLMRRHGVSLSFLESIQDSESVHSVQDVVTLRRYGISSDFLNELGNSSLPLNVDQIIQLRNAGIQADYFNAIHAAGGYQVDDIIQFRRFGISEDLVIAANPPGKEPMTVDAIIELRNRGVSIKTVAELRK